MTFKTSILFIIILSLLGCASTNFSNYWPYSNLPPNKVKALAPKSYSSCLSAIDSILSQKVKVHFKAQDSSVAVIEICDEIGGFFATNWLLYRYNEKYHWPMNECEKLPKTPTDLVSQFIADGIYHPEAMLRVMFTCYYKQLNGQEYDWDYEINKIKNVWPKGNSINYDAKLPEEIAQTENGKISTYKFNLLTVSDTVNILYNRLPKITNKSPDWYYLTGAINYKTPEKELINVKILDIESELNQKYLVWANDTIQIGDTLTVNHSGWLAKNHYYFNYNKCKEMREAFNLR